MWQFLSGVQEKVCLKQPKRALYMKPLTCKTGEKMNKTVYLKEALRSTKLFLDTA